jgi:type IV pilus assembly protein PilA
MRTGKTRGHSGFSLIELLLVVAILLIISAIAVPNFLRARIAANQSSAVQSLRTVNTAQVTYAVMFSGGYADTMAKLGGDPSTPVTVNSAKIIDSSLGCATEPCKRGGYKFFIESTSGAPVTEYKAVAIPVSRGSSGVNGYCSSQENSLRMDDLGGTNCTESIN